MYLDKYREIINSSVLNIPARLRQIDRGYFVVRNHKTRQFEVHHSGQIGGTLALNIPYEELDQRTIDLVRSTRIEYMQNVINEMERNNAKIEEEQERKREDLCQGVVKDIYRYVKAHESKDTIDSDIFKVDK
jgi:hypothetical protein